LQKKGSPYAKGLFLFDITFPQDYPATAPHVTCLTKVFHPSISEDGELQLDALGAGWSPELPAMPRGKQHHLDLIML
jgi:ubiquitin-protein ligase